MHFQHMRSFTATPLYPTSTHSSHSTHHTIIQSFVPPDDDDLFDSEEEEEISKRVLDEGGPPEGSGKVGRATRKVSVLCMCVVCVMWVWVWVICVGVVACAYTVYLLLLCWKLFWMPSETTTCITSLLFMISNLTTSQSRRLCRCWAGRRVKRRL